MFKSKNTKYTLIIALLMMLSYSGIAQFSIQGTVTDEEGELLTGATIQVLDSYRAVSSNAKGFYLINKIPQGKHQLKVSYIGYEDQLMDVDLSKDEVINFKLHFTSYMSKEFTVVGTRLNQESPMAYSTLDKKAIASQNVGQDMPEVLSQSPSVVFTSDAGNGIGYTYMRMRGSDQSNINVTINGIPLNDGESQQVFWVDLPDLSSSTEDIQIQRGVGTSTNGSGAFGGSVNLQTEDISSDPYAAINLAYGSFNTMKTTLKLGTGMLNDHWSFSARGSLIQSDGYVDRSAAKMSSYFTGLQYAGKKTSLRFIAFGGGELTNQAWNGVPEVRLKNDEQGMIDYAASSGWGPVHTQNLLNSDRRYNYYLYDNEVDDYDQFHNQIHWNQELNKNLILNVSGFYTKGKGFFEQYQYQENAFDDNTYAGYGIPDPIIGNDTITSSDFIRKRWLDNDFYGLVFNLSYRKNRWDVVVGGSANQYKGRHFGDVIWSSVAISYVAPFRYYDNSSVKNDINVYAKANYALSEMFSIYGDIQYRHIDYSFLGIDNNGADLEQSVLLDFINPKVGINARLNPNNRIFASFAAGNKEPNRDDFTASTPNDRPDHQTLYDLELGYTLSRQNLIVDVVLYNMQYKNQLVNTGELNDVGAEVRTNAANSYRRGIELIFNYKIAKWLQWSFNSTFSQNKIVDHVEYVDNWDTWGKDTLNLGTTEITFSPSIILGSSIGITLFSSSWNENKKHKMELFLITKYVGEQFIDNTSDATRSIDAYFVNDVRLNYSLENVGLKNISFLLLVRNVFNVDYVSNAWVYKYKSGDQFHKLDGMFAQAGINYMLGINIAF
jgi:iron complex outermembrane receptor protein